MDNYKTDYRVDYKTFGGMIYANDFNTNTPSRNTLSYYTRQILRDIEFDRHCKKKMIGMINRINETNEDDYVDVVDYGREEI